MHANDAVASVTVLGGHARKREQFGWWRSHFPTSGGDEGKPADFSQSFFAWVLKRVERKSQDAS